jgi:glycosyltransferase involved in cell wall biosynthesis
MNGKKRIAVDFSWMGPTGIGRVASEIVDRCPENWKIVPIREGRPNAGPGTPIDLAREIRAADADLFWSPGFMPPAWYGRTPVVLTIHDLTHLHFYKAHHRLYYNVIIRPLVRKASALITVSDFSRNELIGWSGAKPERVVRIHNGIGPSFARARQAHALDKPYILYVGNRREYKNISGLMAAFSRSGLAQQGFVLALSGHRDASCESLERQYGLFGHVRYLGFISEETLPDVYRSAHAVAFVSRYEGFGLPILEGMASGVPVLTSNVSSMPEVAGGAAVLVDPDNAEDIARSLKQICLDEELRARLVIAGQVRASAFSWEKTAQAYWQVFNEVATRRT